MICDRCGTSVNPGVAICPKCGKILKSEVINMGDGKNNGDGKKKIEPKIIVAIVVVVLFVILLLISNSINNKKEEEAQKEEASVQTKVISKVNYYGFSFDIDEDVKYTVTDKLYVYTDDFYASIGVLDTDFSDVVSNKDSLSAILIKQGYDMSQSDISLRTYGKKQYLVLSNILLAGQNYDAIYTNKNDKVIGAMIEDASGKEVTGKQKEIVANVINKSEAVQTADISNELGLPMLNN